MDSTDVKRLEAYLKKTLGNESVAVMKRPQAKDSLEVMINGEFIGIIYKDDDEGEISYPFHMTILDEDLSEV